MCYLEASKLNSSHEKKTFVTPPLAAGEVGQKVLHSQSKASVTPKQAGVTAERVRVQVLQASSHSCTHVHVLHTYNTHTHDTHTPTPTHTHTAHTHTHAHVPHTPHTPTHPIPGLKHPSTSSITRGEVPHVMVESTKSLGSGSSQGMGEGVRGVGWWVCGGRGWMCGGRDELQTDGGSEGVGVGV